MTRRILQALAFRFACYAVMIGLCLLAERRPAPHLPDLLIDRIPYQGWVDRWNYWLLLGCYLPLSVAFLVRDPERFCRYTITAGLLSLLRGLCVPLTGLGPVRGPDVNAGMPLSAIPGALLDLLNPVSVLLRDTPHLYLTKDLFFSGHTSATFLLLLYLLRDRSLRVLALLGHVLVVASLFLAHLHYTIDVVGAYAIAFSLYVLREGWEGAGGGAPVRPAAARLASA
ncbi:MAG: phosphatase PAP2-related protein [Myxococcales bacterium]|nr:sphingomyelin synthase family protein [Myxococcota bacterium]MDW8284266.1 phosphatase PAP2-related protein [Myxococcales bacterium]